MGHGSKRMIYNTYENYVEDLECDFLDVVNYFGKDFLERQRSPRAIIITLLVKVLVKDIRWYM
jgi:hypothetical protein